MKRDILPFKPLIKNSHYQTLFGTMFDFEPELLSEQHRVTLPDGDIISLEVSTPKTWKDDGWTVFMVHGLCGSHRSHYMKRLARKFYKQGIQAVRINLRGCGSGKGLAKGIYHSGSSDDVLACIESIGKRYPKSSKILMGVSLGGNISLKLVGELKEEAKRHIKGVIAISPPADLLASARLLGLPQNAFYANYFLRLLVEDVEFRHQHFQLPPHNLPKNITLNEFDEIYTAQEAKFSNAFEYYYYSSSKRVVHQIALPAKILFAQDDPIIKSTVFDEIDLPEHVEIYKTEYGGHIGFMGWNIFKEFRWMDKVILDWVREFIETS